jgi:hypothetical protein
MRRSLAGLVLARCLPPACSQRVGRRSYCTDWQGIRTCSSPDGRGSHELQWQGMTFGQDSDVNR